MSTASSKAVAAVSREDKLEALRIALESHTFSRSEQLRAFLRYVCEEELAGRGQEITDYSIAREILGRPSSYNPVEDTSVRNRAFALRRKLDELYSSELKDAPVRIALPKGTYRPVFGFFEDQTKVQESERDSIGSLSKGGLLVGFLAGLLVASAAATVGYVHWVSPPPASDAVLREFWGPLLKKNANTLVIVGSPLQLFVRPYPVGDPPAIERPTVITFDPDKDKQIYEVYQQDRTLPPGHRLYANLTVNSPLYGDGIAAILTTQILTQAGASFELWPERAISPSLMRGRNLIMLAREEYSESAELISRSQKFRIGYSAAHKNIVVYNSNPQPGEPAIYHIEDQGSRRTSYGLITVLRSPSHNDEEFKTVMISGLTSGGIQAAAEFFTSRKSLRELKERFRREGHTGIPQQYQVVVKSLTINNMPRTWSYESHRVESQ